MKDWRVLAQAGPLEIEYWYDAADVHEVAAASGAHVDMVLEHRRDALKRKLEPLVASGVEIDTDPHDGHAAGIPPIDDYIWLALSALGGYVTIREVAGDVVKVTRWIRSTVHPRAQISDRAAMIVAWNHLAPADSGSVVEIRSIARLSRVEETGWSSFGHSVFGSDDRIPAGDGWLVGALLNDQPVTVVVANDGSVVGTSPGVSINAHDQLQRIADGPGE